MYFLVIPEEKLEFHSHADVGPTAVAVASFLAQSVQKHCATEFVVLFAFGASILGDPLPSLLLKADPMPNPSSNSRGVQAAARR